MNESSCSLYYYSGENGNLYEINQCVFNGTLFGKSHYIDGVSTLIWSPKMIVKSCKFDDTYEKSVKVSNFYVDIDPNDQQFLKSNELKQ